MPSLNTLQFWDSNNLSVVSLLCSNILKFKHYGTHRQWASWWWWRPFRPSCSPKRCQIPRKWDLWRWSTRPWNTFPPWSKWRRKRFSFPPKAAANLWRILEAFNTTGRQREETEKKTGLVGRLITICRPNKLSLSNWQWLAGPNFPTFSLSVCQFVLALNSEIVSKSGKTV